MTLEEIAKFMDCLYKMAKLYNDSSVYELQKEWYENNGYVVILRLDDETHQVYHKANN